MRLKNFRVAVIAVLPVAVCPLTIRTNYSVIPLTEVTEVTGIHFPYKLLIENMNL
jgi:hypothetical protein